MAKKIYKTIVQVEILSDEPYIVGSIDDIARDISSGGESGYSEVIEDRIELSGKKAVKEIKKHGSDPEFFSMDEDGNEIE